MSEKSWLPEVGVLALRQLLGPGTGRHEMELYYHDHEGGPSHYRTLAEISDFKAKPGLTGSFEHVDGQVEISGSGNVIIRGLAHDWEIRLFKTLWQKSPTVLSFEAWLEEVLKEPKLRSEEKERLVRVFRDRE